MQQVEEKVVFYVSQSRFRSDFLFKLFEKMLMVNGLVSLSRWSSSLCSFFHRNCEQVSNEFEASFSVLIISPKEWPIFFNIHHRNDGKYCDRHSLGVILKGHDIVFSVYRWK